MSVIRRISNWLALRLRAAEPAPDARDLNLPQGTERPQGERDIARVDAELQRRYRRACWRSGPWQQK